MNGDGLYFSLILLERDFGKTLNINPMVCLCQDPAEYEMVPLEAPSKVLTIGVTLNGKTSECYHLFYQEKAYSLILFSETTGIQCKLVSASENRFPVVCFVNGIKYSWLKKQQSKA